MNDGVAPLERSRNRRRIAQVAINLAQVGIATNVVEDLRAIQKKIEDANPVSGVEEFWDQSAADIAGAARYQDFPGLSRTLRHRWGLDAHWRHLSSAVANFS